MPTFGQRSLDNLSEAHPDLQRVMHEAIKEYDFTVICGYRGKAEQDQAFKEKKSKARFGQSPHNFKPALAVDVVPYPIDWKNTKRFEQMGQVIMACAERLGVQLKWGKDFSFVDYPHFELLNWRDLK